MADKSADNAAKQEHQQRAIERRINGMVGIKLKPGSRQSRVALLAQSQGNYAACTVGYQENEDREDVDVDHPVIHDQTSNT